MIHHPDIIQFLYTSIQNITYYLKYTRSRFFTCSMIDKIDLASRLSIFLDYLTLDRIDPVSRIQNRIRDGSFRKKRGAQYDSSAGNTLFTMLSSPSLDPLDAHSPHGLRTGSIDSGAFDESFTLNRRRSTGSFVYSEPSRGNRSRHSRGPGGSFGSPREYSLRRTNSQDSGRGSQRSHNRAVSEQNWTRYNNGSHGHARDLQRWNSHEGERWSDER